MTGAPVMYNKWIEVELCTDRRNRIRISTAAHIYMWQCTPPDDFESKEVESNRQAPTELNVVQAGR